MASYRRAQVHIPAPSIDCLESDSEERLTPVNIARSKSQVKAIGRIIGKKKEEKVRKEGKTAVMETDAMWPDVETYMQPVEKKEQGWRSLLGTRPTGILRVGTHKSRYLPWISLRREPYSPLKPVPSPTFSPIFTTPSKDSSTKGNMSPLPYLTRKQLHREPLIWRSPLGQYKYVEPKRRRSREANKSYFL